MLTVSDKDELVSLTSHSTHAR